MNKSIEAERIVTLSVACLPHMDANADSISNRHCEVWLARSHGPAHLLD